MAKLVGYCEMKKTEGKVLFLVEEKRQEHITGYATDKAFVYGDLAKKIERSTIGKELRFQWEKGYDNKARLVDINIE